jgi:hypothetical protein
MLAEKISPLQNGFFSQKAFQFSKDQIKKTKKNVIDTFFFVIILQEELQRTVIAHRITNVLPDEQNNFKRFRYVAHGALVMVNVVKISVVSVPERNEIRTVTVSVAPAVAGEVALTCRSTEPPLSVIVPTKGFHIYSPVKLLVFPVLIRPLPLLTLTPTPILGDRPVMVTRPLV